ncbi:MAG: hypothetical protein ABI625_07210 [bacterium]
MSASEILRVVVAQLDAARIPFMLTGSVAAAAYGAGRATMDVDLVINATSAQLLQLVAALSGPDVYVSGDAALEALAHQSMFNVVDSKTGWKADLIIRKTRPFSESEFERRTMLQFDDLQLWVATVEDVIIAKLEWAKIGGSARQLEDVSALVRVAGATLDRAYIEHWVAALALDSQWQTLR